MIALDTNILVYAHRPGAPFHEAARARLAALAEGGARWALPWSVVHEFLGVVTHPRGLVAPTPLPVALDAVEDWLGSPSLTVLAEPASYWQGLRSVLERAQATGPRVHGARIAAVCLAHGVRELWTADRDFGRFPGLRTRNPLVG